MEYIEYFQLTGTRVVVMNKMNSLLNFELRIGRHKDHPLELDPIVIETNIDLRVGE